MTVADCVVQKVWTFNGSVSGRFIRVKVGDTIRIHLKNQINSKISHSIDFHNNPRHYGAQAVVLSPAQGAIIEFQMAEDGLYPIVTHAFNFAGRGALGLFKSDDGDPKN